MEEVIGSPECFRDNITTLDPGLGVGIFLVQYSTRN